MVRTKRSKSYNNHNKERTFYAAASFSSLFENGETWFLAAALWSFCCGWNSVLVPLFDH
jgi:hypothetical protein